MVFSYWFDYNASGDNQWMFLQRWLVECHIPLLWLIQILNGYWLFLNLGSDIWLWICKGKQLFYCIYKATNLHRLIVGEASTCAQTPCTETNPPLCRVAYLFKQRGNTMLKVSKVSAVFNTTLAFSRDNTWLLYIHYY